MPKPGKRDEIVDAAIRILARDGDSGLTASALAREAGVSKANLFHHFASLDDIVLEAFEAYLLGMEGMTPPPGGTLGEWLLALGAETQDQVAGDERLAGAYFAFAARAQTDPRIRRRLTEIAEAAEERFRLAITELAPGRFDEKETAALAALILMAGDGLALHRQLFPERAGHQAAGWQMLIECIGNKEKRQ